MSIGLARTRDHVPVVAGRIVAEIGHAGGEVVADLVAVGGPDPAGDNRVAADQGLCDPHCDAEGHALTATVDARAAPQPAVEVGEADVVARAVAGQSQSV